MLVGLSFIQEPALTISRVLIAYLIYLYQGMCYCSPHPAPSLVIQEPLVHIPLMLWTPAHTLRYITLFSLTCLLIIPVYIYIYIYRVSQKSQDIGDYVCQDHIFCAFDSGCSWMSTSRLVCKTSSLYEFVNKFGNSVWCACSVPVKLHHNLATASQSSHKNFNV